MSRNSIQQKVVPAWFLPHDRGGESKTTPKRRFSVAAPVINQFDEDAALLELLTYIHHGTLWTQ